MQCNALQTNKAYLEQAEPPLSTPISHPSKSYEHNTSCDDLNPQRVFVVCARLQHLLVCWHVPGDQGALHVRCCTLWEALDKALRAAAAQRRAPQEAGQGRHNHPRPAAADSLLW